LDEGFLVGDSVIKVGETVGEGEGIVGAIVVGVLGELLFGGSLMAL